MAGERIERGNSWQIDNLSKLSRLRDRKREREKIVYKDPETEKTKENER